jgi:SanA protein
MLPMRFPRLMRRIGLLGVIVVVVVIGVLLALRAGIALRFRGDTYSVETVTPHRVAIIFGARVYPDGRLSAMLSDRVATGVDLYRAGKAQVLLMTGDNTTLEYDEPGAMKRAALLMGVPESAVVVDYAGRRTYDSCYRARDIFQVSDAILVSQDFHLGRALMLCNALGVTAVGVSADSQRLAGYSQGSMVYSQLREFPAVFVGMLDLLFKPTPILGDPLPILPGEDTQD